MSQSFTNLLYHITSQPKIVARHHFAYEPLCTSTSRNEKEQAEPHSVLMGAEDHGMFWPASSDRALSVFCVSLNATWATALRKPITC